MDHNLLWGKDCRGVFPEESEHRCNHLVMVDMEEETLLVDGVLVASYSGDPLQGTVAARGQLIELEMRAVPSFMANNLSDYRGTLFAVQLYDGD
ncbi:hypothetical protein EUGRSUZ_H02506 [Eucalyptus grandis]|uniref:Uncharacterized protein n=2 Tax=Eucalyptus grandis TaxID=71139 RepID=A0ACC3JSR8_EUCGR|nr:hypothetical protein EUGRSUZ_H02506 [Eucalyptus grandis]